MARITGDNSTAIGKDASVSAANSTALGYQASVTAANEIYLGNSAITAIGGIVNWTATSDGRFKTNVQEDVVGLEFIKQLRPVTYTYDTETLNEFQGKPQSETLKAANAAKGKIRYSGFIAQEVAETAQEVGYEFSGVDKPQHEKDIYGLRYAEFVVPMVKGMQELNAKVETQQAIIAEQRALLTAYQQMFSQLEHRLVSLEKVTNDKTKQPRIRMTSSDQAIGQNTVVVQHVSELKTRKVVLAGNLRN